MSSVSPKDYSKEDADIITYTKKARDAEQKSNPNIMFIIARSKNRVRRSGPRPSFFRSFLRRATISRLVFVVI